MTRIHVEGLENVPKSGSLIIVANHLSNADPPLVHGYLTPALGRPMHILAKESLFVGPGGFPAQPGHHAGQGGRQRHGGLPHGFGRPRQRQRPYRFPEGTRSRTGQLGNPKPGVAMLATRTGAPILPVGISGTDRSPAAAVAFRIGARSAWVGKPFTVAVDKSQPRRAAMEAVTDRIMSEIAALVEPRHRGRYKGPDTV